MLIFPFIFFRLSRKVVKSSRESLSKSIRKRKDDAKLRVEIMCDREEVCKTLRSGKEPRPMHSTRNLAGSPTSSAVLLHGKEGEVDGRMDVQGIDEKDVKAIEREKDKDDWQLTPRPCSSNGLVRMDGEQYGQILELWGFLCTFAQPLKVLTIPSISHLTDSIRACEPNYHKLRLHSRGAER